MERFDTKQKNHSTTTEHTRMVAVDTVYGTIYVEENRAQKAREEAEYEAYQLRKYYDSMPKDERINLENTPEYEKAMRLSENIASAEKEKEILKQVADMTNKATNSEYKPISYESFTELDSYGFEQHLDGSDFE